MHSVMKHFVSATAKSTLLTICLLRTAWAGWLYTLPEGSCSQFDTCQTCVVEWAWDTSLRRPCTWCPESGGCQMMNQYTGFCSGGTTYRDTCPIPTDNDLPRCVYIRYSFWVCGNAKPANRNECDAGFADDFCSPQTIDRQVEICNGDSMWLERVSTGFGKQTAVQADKNGYGFELNLKYFWFNAGHGEDRRRIITSAPETESEIDMWLCNAQNNPDQATVLKYQVYNTDNTDKIESSDGSSDESAGGSSSALATLIIVYSFLSSLIF